MLCFFLQTLSHLNSQFKRLFDNGDDDEGADGIRGNKLVERFTRNYGWIYTTRELATFEGISLEQAFNLPVVQALNDLLYLKEKIEYDKLIMKLNKN